MGEIRQCLHENLAALLTILFHLEKAGKINRKIASVKKENCKASREDCLRTWIDIKNSRVNLKKSPACNAKTNFYFNNNYSRSRRRAEKVDKRMVLVHTHGLFIT
jgi:hypothetical protein